MDVQHPVMNTAGNKIHQLFTNLLESKLTISLPPNSPNRHANFQLQIGHTSATFHPWGWIRD